MNTVLESSELTQRPRLEVAFSTSPSHPSAAITANAVDEAYVVDLYLPAVSAWASEAFMAPVGPERESRWQIDVIPAFDSDFDALIDEAKQSRSTEHRRLVKVLKAWNKRSEGSKRVLSSYVIEALAYRSRRPAQRESGPRPNVKVFLSLPWSMARSTTVEPIRDVDLMLVYWQDARADEDLERLAQAMTPDVTVPSPAVVLQARRNAQARTELLTEFGALTASQVAELSGSEAKNRSALAGRWRREGRLVAVEHHGTTYYPAFQFDEDGTPRPVVERVLNHLDDPRMTGWQQALWFTTANGWLDGRRPVDLLESEPEAVIAAARDALREPVG